jgi:hypothetical protein
MGPLDIMERAVFARWYKVFSETIEAGGWPPSARVRRGCQTHLLAWAFVGVRAVVVAQR